MKKIMVFPTWVLIKFMRPFLPKEHLFKNQKITLNNWAKNSTDLNKGFSILFWIFGIFISVYPYYGLFNFVTN